MSPGTFSYSISPNFVFIASLIISILYTAMFIYENIPLRFHDVLNIPSLHSLQLPLSFYPSLQYSFVPPFCSSEEVYLLVQEIYFSCSRSLHKIRDTTIFFYMKFQKNKKNKPKILCLFTKNS